MSSRKVSGWLVIAVAAAIVVVGAVGSNLPRERDDNPSPGENCCPVLLPPGAARSDCAAPSEVSDAGEASPADTEPRSNSDAVGTSPDTEPRSNSDALGTSPDTEPRSNSDADGTPEGTELRNPAAGDIGPHGTSGTFSIVAVDPDSGICGGAVASMYPAVGRVVPYVEAGVGVFCTQHWHEPEWGPRAIELLAAGRTCEEVLAELLTGDPHADRRQLAIIDRRGRALNRHPTGAAASGWYWGGMSGRFYACQGNTLTGREVIVAMAEAYETTEGSLADRLLAALLAGDCAGGDHRGRLAAGLRVARPGVEGLWLDLQVERSDDAVIELAQQYAQLVHEAKGAWRGGQLPFEPPCPDRPAPRPPAQPVEPASHDE